MSENPIYSDTQVKHDLVGGVLNYLVYEQVGEKGLERLADKAEKIIDGMPGEKMRLVVALIIRDPTMDLMDLIERVKEGYVD